MEEEVKAKKQENKKTRERKVTLTCDQQKCDNK